METAYNLIYHSMSYKFTYRAITLFAPIKEITINVSDIQAAHREFRDLVGDCVILSIHPKK